MKLKEVLTEEDLIYLKEAVEWCYEDSDNYLDEGEVNSYTELKYLMNKIIDSPYLKNNDFITVISQRYLDKLLNVLEDNAWLRYADADWIDYEENEKALSYKDKLSSLYHLYPRRKERRLEIYIDGIHCPSLIDYIDIGDENNCVLFFNGKHDGFVKQIEEYHFDLSNAGYMVVWFTTKDKDKK